MSHDNELSNIIRDLEKIENYSKIFSKKELSDLHGRIIQLPRTDRSQLYRDEEYVVLEEVLDWQQTCPPDKRITDDATISEEDVRIAFEINKKVAICKRDPQTIECDALLDDDWVSVITSRYATKSGGFNIYRARFFSRYYLFDTANIGNIVRDYDSGNVGRLPPQITIWNPIERNRGRIYVQLVSKFNHLQTESTMFACNWFYVHINDFEVVFKRKILGTNYRIPPLNPFSFREQSTIGTYSIVSTLRPSFNGYFYTIQVHYKVCILKKTKIKRADQTVSALEQAVGQRDRLGCLNLFYRVLTWHFLRVSSTASNGRKTRSV